MTAASKPGTDKDQRDTLITVPFPLALSRCRYAHEHTSDTNRYIPAFTGATRWNAGMKAGWQPAAIREGES